MYLDEKAIATHRAELEDRYGRVMKELEEVTNGINVNSTLQIREYLYDTLNFDELTKRGEPQRTPSGLPKTDQATIGRS
jgi:DNA polymerase I-like protein with 3'-5' exonuclease and polymerase domains